MNESVVRAIVKSEVSKAVAQDIFYASTTTEDATITPMLTIEIPENTTGTFEVDLVAGETSMVGKITSKRIIGFIKDTALTLDTADSLHDQDTLGAVWQMVNDSENATVEVTGVALTTIYWEVRVKQILITPIPIAP